MPGRRMRKSPAASATRRAGACRAATVSARQRHSPSILSVDEMLPAVAQGVRRPRMPRDNRFTIELLARAIMPRRRAASRERARLARLDRVVARHRSLRLTSSAQAGLALPPRNSHRGTDEPRDAPPRARSARSPGSATMPEAGSPARRRHFFARMGAGTVRPRSGAVLHQVERFAPGELTGDGGPAQGRLSLCSSPPCARRRPQSDRQPRPVASIVWSSPHGPGRTGCLARSICSGVMTMPASATEMTPKRAALKPR